MNPFSAVVKGLKWVGKELTAVPSWIKKVITVTDDVEQDAQTLLPEAVTVLEDSGAVVVAAVKDSGADLTAADALVAAIEAAAQADGVNIEDDENVIAALKAFGTQVTSTTNFKDVLTAVKKLVVDWDALEGGATAALKKLEADA